MFMILMGTVVIAGIVGYISEKTGFTNNGIIQSISCGSCSASALVRPV
jgi:hypothetical protein